MIKKRKSGKKGFIHAEMRKSNMDPFFSCLFLNFYLLIDQEKAKEQYGKRREKEKKKKEVLNMKTSTSMCGRTRFTLLLQKNEYSLTPLGTSIPLAKEKKISNSFSGNFRLYGKRLFLSLSAAHTRSHLFFFSFFFEEKKSREMQININIHHTRRKKKKRIT